KTLEVLISIYIYASTASEAEFTDVIEFTAYCLKMTDLSKDDRDFIAKHPLDDTLNHLRDILRKADVSPQIYDIILNNPR
ncbi:MAG: hypothetical protein Q9163_004214, partial [Psora crenata]